MMTSTSIVLALLIALTCLLFGCAATSPDSPGSTAREETPPPRIQAWMDQLTVDHRYDPETGFIVAREVVALPSVLTAGPSLADAVVQSRDTNTLLIVFATADRCAPCQQYKKDALNDSRVIRRLMRDDVLATHIEVDRDPAAAQKYLGSAAIPMTYLLRHGEVVETLPGQRSADTLYEWLNSHVN